MNPLRSRLAGAVLAAAALTSLAACSNSSGSATDAAGPDPVQQVTTNARAYISAWMATEPADAKAMCALQTKAARPNFSKDGGTLDGCVAQRRRNSTPADPSAAPRGPLTITISNVQDVPASATHPAGKGALATMSRPGRDPFRYALRLVKEGDSWLVEQTTDVGTRFKHTADPVAPVLAQYS
ncbi:hypothetical protein QMK19_34630 [Streptomyces sp. H10-C2]|uniref:hypothetical protein n=1 Tax=unclassified Streptomyces TaxID=2593676 RepID=UPI0024B89E46|nr:MULTISPECIES: hypothetical protein [unclassified Streptomyces]MDJ0346958.1 hypothetical protein [Streptomyces sp. PH10-H1]MDJ0374623.1 hypothetical protein [Streptomyces sp. H10-C2]